MGYEDGEVSDWTDPQSDGYKAPPSTPEQNFLLAIWKSNSLNTKCTADDFFNWMKKEYVPCPSQADPPMSIKTFHKKKKSVHVTKQATQDQSISKKLIPETDSTKTEKNTDMGGLWSKKTPEQSDSHKDYSAKAGKELENKNKVSVRKNCFTAKVQSLLRMCRDVVATKCNKTELPFVVDTKSISQNTSHNPIHTFQLDTPTCTSPNHMRQSWTQTQQGIKWPLPDHDEAYDIDSSDDEGDRMSHPTTKTYQTNGKPAGTFDCVDKFAIVPDQQTAVSHPPIEFFTKTLAPNGNNVMSYINSNMHSQGHSTAEKSSQTHVQTLTERRPKDQIKVTSPQTCINRAPAHMQLEAKERKDNSVESFAINIDDIEIDHVHPSTEESSSLQLNMPKGQTVCKSAEGTKQKCTLTKPFDKDNKTIRSNQNSAATNQPQIQAKAAEGQATKKCAIKHADISLADIKKTFKFIGAGLQLIEDKLKKINNSWKDAQEIMANMPTLLNEQNKQLHQLQALMEGNYDRLLYISQTLVAQISLNPTQHYIEICRTKKSVERELKEATDQVLALSFKQDAFIDHLKAMGDDVDNNSGEKPNTEMQDNAGEKPNTCTDMQDTTKGKYIEVDGLSGPKKEQDKKQLSNTKDKVLHQRKKAPPMDKETDYQCPFTVASHYDEYYVRGQRATNKETIKSLNGTPKKLKRYQLTTPDSEVSNKKKKGRNGRKQNKEKWSKSAGNNKPKFDREAGNEHNNEGNKTSNNTTMSFRNNTIKAQGETQKKGQKGLGSQVDDRHLFCETHVLLPRHKDIS